MNSSESTRLRLGAFELNLKTGELCLPGADSDGRKVLLQEQPFRVLRFLIDRSGEIATREEIKQRLWPDDTSVDFDHSINVAIATLRRVFGDSAVECRYIETIPRRGYRLIVPVERVEPLEEPPKNRPVRIEAVPGTPKSWRNYVVAASSILVLALVGYLSWRHYQSAALPKTGRVMLAVLPFENLTGDPNKEYLADGLTEETISQLGRLNPEQLGVIARTSVMGYKHKDERLDQIGRDLSVQYVLENSLRESGDHIRLTAQLIQVKDQSHLWSQDYDYPAKDILNVEDDVARAVAQQIRLRLTSKQKVELAQSHPVYPEAFDAYMQGHYYFERNTGKDAEMAAKYYERSTQLDPSLALAWVGLSRVRNWQVNIDLIPAEEGHRLAREAVERALALNPDLAEARTQMGRLKEQVDFDWAGADASFRRAVELEPGNPEFVRMVASSAAILGRFDEALPLARHAIDLDPLNALSWEILAETEFYMGRLDEAAADCKKGLELSPDAWPGPILLSRIYLTQGQPHDALPQIGLIRFDASRAWLYAIAYHALGREKESDAALSELIAKYHEPAMVADVYAYRAQPDKAFEWLDRAYAQRDDGLIHTKVEPLLKNLHSDPRYAALLKKLNFPA
jgi:TolB-like protein/DNA-binding winged helix-turn-helix (wHTH) protein